VPIRCIVLAAPTRRIVAREPASKKTAAKSGPSPPLSRVSR
jgi:hypothetical protein